MKTTIPVFPIVTTQVESCSQTPFSIPYAHMGPRMGARRIINGIYTDIMTAELDAIPIPPESDCDWCDRPMCECVCPDDTDY